MNPADHPALQRTYWVNLYKDGTITGVLADSECEASNACTKTNERPDAETVEVRLVPVEKVT